MRPFSSKQLTAALAALALSACGPESLPEEGEQLDEGASTQAITDVEQSVVKRQSIGNCWLYATASWAESLVKRQTRTEYNLSESYWTYWHWFEQIANGRASDEISTGGSWGIGVELILRYGIMREADFIPEEAAAEMSARQKSALAAINASLASGALATSTARRDRALVRAELDKAWRLSPTVVANLDAVFNKNVTRTLDRSTVSTEGRGILRAAQLGAGQDGARVITLKDVIGVANSSWDPDSRRGTYAWSEVSYPSSASARRAMQIRVQKALHASKPVITSWFVDFNALNRDGVFFAPPATVGHQGGHMTVLEDYEVENVPGYGTLKAGALETRPEALAAALDPSATLKFLRVKNSWGSFRPDRPFIIPGYHDLYLGYLNGPVNRCTRRAAEPVDVDEESRECIRTAPIAPQSAFVLPPGF